MEAKENATERPQIGLSYSHNINDHISKECQYSLVTPSGLFGHSLRTRTVNFLPIRIQNIKLTDPFSLVSARKKEMDRNMRTGEEKLNYRIMRVPTPRGFDKRTLSSRRNCP